MCDTLFLLTGAGALFAKNSDRPVDEPQVLSAHPRRDGGGTLRTQYLELRDTGAYATILSRPTWLWGAEHGVNERGVAIGNERVYGIDDPAQAPPALIGMDLVRLGLERATDAEVAVDVMTDLLERHGQGGPAESPVGGAYWSSFLVADPSGGWVLETSGRTWAARPLSGSGAVSNRCSIRTDWTRASADVPPGADFDAWRDPASPTGHADRRLAASAAFLAGAPSATLAPSATGPAGTVAASAVPAGAVPAGAVAAGAVAAGTVVTGTEAPSEVARRMVGHLRDHGSGPWGAPGASGPVVPPPERFRSNGTGVTVCMHLRGHTATTASMIVELRDDVALSVRGWAALGSPCASVYVPFALTSSGPVLPGALKDEAVWRRLAECRDRVEADPGALGTVRDVLGKLEDDLWARAQGLGDDAIAWGALAADADRRVRAALNRMVAAAI